MTEKLKILLNSLRLKEKVIPPDGNCFYSCIVHQLWGLDPSASQFLHFVNRLRFESSNYLELNLTEPLTWHSLCLRSSEAVVSRGITDNNLRIRTYLNNIKFGSEWANEDVMVAITVIYNISIVIIRNDTGDQFCIGNPDFRKVYVVYYPFQHYNSVEFVDSGCPVR